MKVSYFKVSLLLLIVAILGCNNYYIKSVYPIPSKKLSKQEAYYKNTYGKVNFLNDSIIVGNDKLYRSYSQGLLIRIGKMYDDKPVGYWFTFEDSLSLEYILKYDEVKVDSFYHPFTIVQQSW